MNQYTDCEVSQRRKILGEFLLRQRAAWYDFRTANWTRSPSQLLGWRSSDRRSLKQAQSPSPSRDERNRMCGHAKRRSCSLWGHANFLGKLLAAFHPSAVVVDNPVGGTVEVLSLISRNCWCSWRANSSEDKQRRLIGRSRPDRASGGLVLILSTFLPLIQFSDRSIYPSRWKRP